MIKQLKQPAFTTPCWRNERFASKVYVNESINLDRAKKLTVGEVATYLDKTAMEFTAPTVESIIKVL
jgi:hypothetical protein